MTDLDPNAFGPDQPCFGCGPRHPTGFQLRFERDGEHVVTRFTPGEHHQGPPGIMHGGLVSTLADELAAWAIIGGLGKFGFTATMSLRFRKPVRIGVEVVGRARITREKPRLVDVAVVLSQGEHDCLTGDLTFVLFDQAGAEKLIGGPLPESWQRFAR